MAQKYYYVKKHLRWNIIFDEGILSVFIPGRIITDLETTKIQ